MKNKIPVIVAAALLVATFVLYCFQGVSFGADKDMEILRVYNWEEYISESKEDESIDIITQFEKYCKEVLNRNVKVEYSTFGTNENMYNELNLSKKNTANGVTYSYDLVCPSEYMLLKMMREGMLERLDMSKVPNYASNASPYIQNLFKTLKNEGSDDSLYDYAACYMWGTMGYVYNPEIVSDEDAFHWNLLWKDKYKGLGTIKDSVRDSYILAVGYCLQDELNGVLEDYK
ncbi:MAG TPA: spermidine/putrescine ABC transporter substrate-binding protein, partial [Clostridiales bacterium]|nr:spermidine/putrescine ABC transporter substrate-binding protein [Clostridiales bacterium]